jgi:CDP-diacylglycerol--serine O-phosphatidyltransferase
MLATSESVKAYMPAWPEYAIAAYTIFIALLMVSRVPTFSLKGLRIPRRMLAIVLIALVLLFAQFVSQPFLTVAALAAVYLLTVVWSMIASMLGLRNRKPAQPQD